MRPNTCFALLSLILCCSCSIIEPQVRRPEDTVLHNMHREAQEAYQKGNLDKAVEIYQKIISVSNVDAETWFVIGNTYAGRGENELAIASYKKSLALNGGDARVLNNLSVLLTKEAWKAARLSQERSFEGEPARISSSKILEILGGLSFLSEGGDESRDSVKVNNISAVQAKTAVDTNNQSVPSDSSRLNSAPKNVSEKNFSTTKANELTEASNKQVGTTTDYAADQKSGGVVVNPSAPALSELDKQFNIFVLQSGIKVETIKGVKPKDRSDSITVRSSEKMTLLAQNILDGKLKNLTILKNVSQRIPIQAQEIYQFSGGLFPSVVFQGTRVPKNIKQGVWLRFVSTPDN